MEIYGLAFPQPAYYASDSLLIQFFSVSRSPAQVLLYRQFEILHAFNHGACTGFTASEPSQVQIYRYSKVIDEKTLSTAAYPLQPSPPVKFAIHNPAPFCLPSSKIPNIVSDSVYHTHRPSPRDRSRKFPETRPAPFPVIFCILDSIIRINGIVYFFQKTFNPFIPGTILIGRLSVRAHTESRE